MRKLKTITIPILALMTVFTFSKCNENTLSEIEKTEDVIKYIEISNSSFSEVYPAVWFNPSSAEISPMTEENGEMIEEPPGDDWYWVEPEDPEFSNWWLENGDNIKFYGVKYLGVGDDIFNSPIIDDSQDFNYGVFDTEEYRANCVYYIKTKSGECVIQLLDLITDDNYLRFKWKKL